MSLDARMEKLGRTLGEREAAHREALDSAKRLATELHSTVASALGAFHAGAGAAAHLRAQVSEPRTDDKHVRAVEFEIQRGCHRAIVTVKSKGQVTLVGPFQAGKNEGPCASFAWDARDEIEAALGDFLERFLEQAAFP